MEVSESKERSTELFLLIINSGSANEGMWHHTYLPFIYSCGTIH